MYTPNDIAAHVLFSSYNELFDAWLSTIIASIEYEELMQEGKHDDAEYLQTLASYGYEDYEVIEDTLTFELSQGLDMKLGISGKSDSDYLLVSLYASDIEVSYAKVSLNSKATYNNGVAYCCEKFNTTLSTYLDVLSTHREYQGEGYGTMLLSLLSDLLPKPIVAECLPFGRVGLPREDLLAWYAKRGFSHVDVELIDYIYHI